MRVGVDPAKNLDATSRISGGVPLAREDACRNCQAGPLVWFAGTPFLGRFCPLSGALAFIVLSFILCLSPRP